MENIFKRRPNIQFEEKLSITRRHHAWYTLPLENGHIVDQLYESTRKFDLFFFIAFRPTTYLINNMNFTVVGHDS